MSLAEASFDGTVSASVGTGSDIEADNIAVRAPTHGATVDSYAPGASAGQIGYSDFLEEVRAKRIKSVTLQESPGGGTEIIALTTDDKRLRSTATYLDRGLVGDLINNNVKFDVRPREEGSLLMTLLVSWGPMLLLIGVCALLALPVAGAPRLADDQEVESQARVPVLLSIRATDAVTPDALTSAATRSSAVATPKACAPRYARSAARNVSSPR